MNCHEIENHLTQYLLGDLLPADAEQVRQHLARCASCAAQARELEATLDLLRSAMAGQPAAAPAALDTARRRQIRRTRIKVFLTSPKMARIAAVLIAAIGTVTILATWVRVEAPRMARIQARIMDGSVETAGQEAMFDKLEELPTLEALTPDSREEWPVWQER